MWHFIVSYFKMIRLAKYIITLQCVINVKLSLQRFWPRHKNLLIKTIPKTPQNLYVCFNSGSICCGLGNRLWGEAEIFLTFQLVKYSPLSMPKPLMTKICINQRLESCLGCFTRQDQNAWLGKNWNNYVQSESQCSTEHLQPYQRRHPFKQKRSKTSHTQKFRFFFQLFGLVKRKAICCRYWVVPPHSVVLSVNFSHFLLILKCTNL